MPLKQDSRLVAIKTALGPDVLALRSVSVQEQLSRLFQIDAELSSEDGEIDLDKVVGRDATIRLNIGQKEKRYFNGVVSRLVQVANQGGYAHYRATIVPWLWFLTRTSDCRIFQEKSVPDIIEEVFKGHGFSDYQLKLSGSYEPREYCVQYRETDFNFVSRLMEEDGIYYFFEHEDGKHTLVLADSMSANKPFPGYAEVIFHELDKGGAAEREVITDWTVEKEVQAVAYALTDFDFKKPKTSLLVPGAPVPRKYGKAEFEHFDYPGEYLKKDEGERLSNVRIEELQTQYEVLHGQASARGLASGFTFKLKNHPRANQNREYLITSVTLQADAGEFGSTADAGAGGVFSCGCRAIEKAQQFRPARITPKPIVQGPQTAIVVGPSGEEIYTDEHARVKVHFHWDRHDKSDENSSCWIRVSQYWAGKEWGTIHIPRIGQEVIVEFLEGDPDRPIITGRVYNADQVPPYGLPGNKTQSGLKSRSSKGGSVANFNEIRFEDKKGSEEVYIHAEKDQNNIVEHDETTNVGHDRTEDVGHDEKITIGNNRTEKVGMDEDITIGSNRTEKVGSNETITIGANRTEKVVSNEKISIGGNRTEDVTGNEGITIKGNRTEDVTGNEGITIKGNRTEAVTGNEGITIKGNRTEGVTGNETISVSKDRSVSTTGGETLSVGKDQGVTVTGQRTTGVNKDDTLNVAKNLKITAGDSISITTGKASITMKKDGTIQINGKDISVEGSGEINAKASKDITMKGKKILQN